MGYEAAQPFHESESSQERRASRMQRSPMMTSSCM